jgi:hypothetical protein
MNKNLIKTKALKEQLLNTKITPYAANQGKTNLQNKITEKKV